jgi:hypothetical protein
MPSELQDSKSLGEDVFGTVVKVESIRFDCIVRGEVVFESDLFCIVRRATHLG